MKGRFSGAQRLFAAEAQVSMQAKSSAGALGWRTGSVKSLKYSCDKEAQAV